MGNDVTNVYAKFRNFPLRINKALGIFRKRSQQEQQQQQQQQQQEEEEEQPSWRLGTFPGPKIKVVIFGTHCSTSAWVKTELTSHTHKFSKA